LPLVVEDNVVFGVCVVLVCVVVLFVADDVVWLLAAVVDELRVVDV